MDGKTTDLTLDFRLHVTVPSNVGLDGLDNIIKDAKGTLTGLTLDGHPIIEAEYRDWGVCAADHSPEH